LIVGEREGFTTLSPTPLFSKKIDPMRNFHVLEKGLRGLWVEEELCSPSTQTFPPFPARYEKRTGQPFYGEGGRGMGAKSMRGEQSK
jgi:hypothetical protein